jgi:thiol-disulfide isomerase/thioredoxin
MQVNFITILLLILILIIIYHFFISSKTENFINNENCENALINKNTVSSEDLINKKKLTLYIFLSKKCHHCIDYDNLHHKKIVDDLGSNYDIKKIYSDDDKDKLFNKFNIRYVPKGVLELDDNTVEVKGQIRSEVVKNAEKILNNMVVNNKNTETNNKNTEIINKKKLLVFLSKTCPHCVNYIKNTHNQLLNELGNEYLIQLLYSDQDSDNLFDKYNVNYVPKCMVISNGKEYEVKGHLNSENIRNTDKSINIEHMELDEINDDENSKINKNSNINDEANNKINDETNYKSNDESNYKTNDESNDESNYKTNDESNDETNYKSNDESNDETNYKINDKINDKINSEMNNKKKLLVFLSKTCPYCTRYEKDTHAKLLNELDNNFVIKKVYIDEDEDNLFNKYNVKYVPKGIVISKGKEFEVNGQLKSENILNADKSMNIEHMNMISKNTELEKKNLLIFLSKTCPHCVTYDNNMHEKLKMELGNECNIKKIYADNDNDGLFNKYNIRYVPAGVILSRQRYIPIEGVINIENVKKQIKKLKN